LNYADILSFFRFSKYGFQHRYGPRIYHFPQVGLVAAGLKNLDGQTCKWPAMTAMAIAISLFKH
jgi:hypothetical protein